MTKQDVQQGDDAPTSTAPTPEPETKGRNGAWKRWLGYAAAAAVLLPLAGIVMVAVLLVFITDSAEVLRLQDFASRLHSIGLAAQALVVALVIGRWKALVSWGAAKGIVQPFEIERVLAFRSKAATFLFLYLILIPIGPSRIWSLFTGTAG